MGEDAYKPCGSQNKNVDSAYEALYRRREIVNTIFTSLMEHEILHDHLKPFHYHGMPKRELFKILSESYGVTIEEFNKIIRALIRRGDIYEPIPNFLRRS
jgi:hypothetical protein